MFSMQPKFEVQTRILKPVDEVFDAVYNPKKLSGYFTTGGASAPLNEGTIVMWEFADFPGSFPVQVKKVIPNKQIVLEWQAMDDNYNTRVEMNFDPVDANSTRIRISESGWRENEKGVKSSYDNCGGWMQMECCLKAYLEYGINLRKGAN
jgi:uncharacterized protein YndB with AHSA1/START domain